MNFKMEFSSCHGNYAKNIITILHSDKKKHAQLHFITGVGVATINFATITM